MDRAKVILHMMVSLDGKIEGYFADAPYTGPCGDFYDEVIGELGDAEGTGSYTAQLYMAGGNPDLNSYEEVEVEEGDFITASKEDKILFVFDRFGKCMWESNESNGKKVVAVLTKKAKKSYLAYLRSIGVSYIFAGEGDLELIHALEKIKSLFDVDTLVLCGGATINGAFLKAGLVDGISEVMVPHVEGNHDQKGIAETDVFVRTAFPLKKAIPIAEGKGVHLIFERE